MKSKFRRYILTILLLIGAVIPWVTSAQTLIRKIDSNSLEEHIILLERSSKAHGQLLNQLQQQLSENQRDIDTFRGQVQENQYQLNQVVDHQRKIYQQMKNLSQSCPQTRGAIVKTTVSTISNGSTSASALSFNPLDEKSEYNTAVSLALGKKQNDLALSIFQLFLKKYPNSIYQANANYWIGQLFYEKGKKDDAAYYFAIVVKNYTKSHKAPDAMYKVGMLMKEKGHTKKANAVFHQLIQRYPTSAAAVLAKSRIAS